MLRRSLLLACCLACFSPGCGASSGPSVSPAPPVSATPAAPGPSGAAPAASSGFAPHTIAPDPGSPRYCKQAYSRYPGALDVFHWDRHRDASKEAIPGVRMRLSARSSGTYGGGSMVAWLMEDGRVFLGDAAFRPDRATHASPACRVEPEAMRRFEERLRSPIVLFFPPPYEPLDVPPEERVVVEHFFLLPSSIGRDASDDQVPLCFSEPGKISRRMAKTMRSQRIAVWMEGKGHEIDLRTSGYDGLMEYLIEPLRGCEKLDRARKSALYSASD